MGRAALKQQVQGAHSQVGGYQDGPGEVPEPVDEGAVKTRAFHPELGAGAGGVQQKAYGPDKLVWFSPGEKLVKDNYGENKTDNTKKED